VRGAVDPAGDRSAEGHATRFARVGIARAGDTAVLVEAPA
jgi:hypothetical protein